MRPFLFVAKFVWFFLCHCWLLTCLCYFRQFFNQGVSTACSIFLRFYHYFEVLKSTVWFSILFKEVFSWPLFCPSIGICLIELWYTIFFIFMTSFNRMVFVLLHCRGLESCGTFSLYILWSELKNTHVLCFSSFWFIVS